MLDTKSLSVKTLLNIRVKYSPNPLQTWLLGLGTLLGLRLGLELRTELVLVIFKFMVRFLLSVLWWGTGGLLSNIRHIYYLELLGYSGPMLIASDFSVSGEREREFFYLTTHSTHFIYGYMASDIWLRTILIVRKETRCCHIGYSYPLTARVLLYAPSHRQDNTYHSLYYTSRGALAGTRNTVSGYEITKIQCNLHNTQGIFKSIAYCK